MSNTGKRIEGAAEELGGQVRSVVGAFVGDEQLQAEGHAQQTRGVVKQEVAKAAERIKGAVEEVAGTLKGVVGAVVGNHSLEGEAKVDETKGKLRQEANR